MNYSFMDICWLIYPTLSPQQHSFSSRSLPTPSYLKVSIYNIFASLQTILLCVQVPNMVEGIKTINTMLKVTMQLQSIDSH